MKNYFSRCKASHCILGACAVLLLMQLIPYGHNHTNPPIRQEPAWNSPETRALAVRACFDCHSNTTAWPWYASVAPLSWVILQHVEEGRSKVNFSEWDLPQKDGDELVKVLDENEMPLSTYVPMHQTARLTAQEKQILRQGLQHIMDQLPPK